MSTVRANSFEHCAVVGLLRCGTDKEHHRACSGLACRTAHNKADKRRKLRALEARRG